MICKLIICKKLVFKFLPKYLLINFIQLEGGKNINELQTS